MKNTDPLKNLYFHLASGDRYRIESEDDGRVYLVNIKTGARKNPRRSTFNTAFVPYERRVGYTMIDRTLEVILRHSPGILGCLSLTFRDGHDGIEVQIRADSASPRFFREYLQQAAEALEGCPNEGTLEDVAAFFGVSAEAA